MKIFESQRTQSTQYDENFAKKSHRKLKSFKIKTLGSQNQESSKKVRDLGFEKDELVRSFIQSRVKSLSSKRQSLNISNLFVHETPGIFEICPNSLGYSPVRNSQALHISLKLPSKSLPKINTKKTQLKRVIQNCQILSHMIQQQSKDPVTPPIHTKPKHLEDVEVKNLFTPNRQKIKLQAIKPVQSPEKQLKKLLKITNVERNIDGSLNKKCFKNRNHIFERK